MRQAGGAFLSRFHREHGLRPESAEEAALVKKRLEALGIEAEILPWLHGPVQTKIHVEARKARYALLLDACRRHGLKTLFLAHHRDDQAETILMRLAKGSGVEGLSGMAPVTERDGVRLVRPFLNVPKAQLVALCEAEGVAYVVDPSNEKEKYARGRLRRVQEALAQEGLTTERLLDLGERRAKRRRPFVFYAQAFLREKAKLLDGGAIRLEAEAFAALPRAVGLKVLALCLAFVHRPIIRRTARPCADL
jgi:tRNA(Ile)-lysidine synthase